MSNFPASDGTSLFERVWPTASPRGVVALLHGYGEHIGRYEHVAAAMNGAGFSVYGMDLRGHGQSGGARGFCRRFDEFVDDAGLLLSRARRAASGLPVFLVGHSFGGLIATRVAQRGAGRPNQPDRIDGMVLSSPF